jgi:hypothetical protein
MAFLFVFGKPRLGRPFGGHPQDMRDYMDADFTISGHNTAHHSIRGS